MEDGRSFEGLCSTSMVNLEECDSKGPKELRKHKAPTKPISGTPLLRVASEPEDFNPR